MVQEVSNFKDLCFLCIRSKSNALLSEYSNYLCGYLPALPIHTHRRKNGRGNLLVPGLASVWQTFTSGPGLLVISVPHCLVESKTATLWLLFLAPASNCLAAYRFLAMSTNFLLIQYIGG